MASLTGQTISSTYDSLLKVTDNGPITSSLKTVTDGLGNSSSLELSTISARFGGTIVGQSSLDISAEIYHRNNIAVLNKLENSWIHWATRNTAGSDAVINLSNIGTLTLNSTISNGTYIYTLPSATGTLALTSNLSSYLPLTGGTLTGTINGTNAVFSTGITSQGSFIGTREKSQSFFAGYAVGINISSGGSNTFTGYGSGTLLTSGSSNTFYGTFSGTSATTGNGNTLIGNSAGVAITTGSQNTFFGSDAGSGITTGSGNTIIGLAGVLSSTLTNNIILASGVAIKAQHDGINWTFTGGTILTGSLSGTSATFSSLAGTGDRIVVTNSSGLVSSAVIGSGLSYSGGILTATGGGGGGGTVTSVAALTLGTSGTDLNSSVANPTTTPVITLNVPDASATARGVITTGIQTISGSKTLTSTLFGTSATFNGNLGVNASSFTSSAFYTDLLIKSPTSADAGITINGGTGSSYLYLSHDLTGTLPFLEIGEYNGSMQMLHYNGTQNNRAIVYNGTTKKLTFQTDGTDRVTVFNTGNAFIGSFPTDAGYKLDVNGTGRFSGSLSGTSATFSGTLATSAGAAINSGNGALAISASATRGIINIAGSTDQILTFSSQSYIYNSSSLFRILSSNDIDFVAGGFQRLLISASTGAATFTSTVTATEFKVTTGGGGLSFNSGDAVLDYTSGSVRLRQWNGAGYITPLSILSSTGATTLSSLAGTGTRMVVSDSTGLLSTQAIPGGGGGSVDELQVALLSQVYG